VNAVFTAALLAQPTTGLLTTLFSAEPGAHCWVGECFNSGRIKPVNDVAWGASGREKPIPADQESAGSLAIRETAGTAAAPAASVVAAQITGALHALRECP
jgi:hypothetical protein